MSKVEITKKIDDKTFVYQKEKKDAGLSAAGWWWLKKNNKLDRIANEKEYEQLTKIEKVDSQKNDEKKDDKKDDESKADNQDDDLDDNNTGPMGYAKAKKIRKQSFGDIFAQKMANGESIGQSFKSTFSDRGKAKLKGLKEIFDPQNIAKAVGGKVGASIYGRVMNRSKEDNEYFTETKASKKGKGSGDGGTDMAEKLGPTEDGNSFLSTLMSIQELLSKREEDNKAQREKEGTFAEENKAEKERRHNELIAAITGKKIESAPKNDTATKESGDFPDYDLAGSFKESAKRAAVQGAEKAAIKSTATKIGKDVIKRTAVKTLGKTIGKGVLKSIPILGAAIGSGFAIGRLIDGDVVGAGIEAASGLGSALTSIPLTITNAARDVYKEVYGDFPDPTNPEDQKNLSEIYDICKEVAAELLKDSATEAPKPGEMQTDMMGNATGYATPETTTPTKPTSTSPASSTPTPSSPSAPASPVSSTPTPPAPAPKSTASATASPNSGSELNQVQSENLNVKVQETLSKGESVVNNNQVSNSLSSVDTTGPLPSVRNSDPTFQRMIFDSTRVV
jgi:hypothetical protein